MNFIEAIKLLDQGYKVTKDCWDKENYIYLEGSLVFDEEEEMYDFGFSDYLYEDWKIYLKERKLHTFVEAIVALKNGKTIKRKLWTTEVIERDFCDDYSIEFTIDDFEANDWIIVGDEIGK